MTQPKKISQPKIIPYMLRCIHRLGDWAKKRVVEQEVYEELKAYFDQPYYQVRTVSGIPRWQENIDYARNLAKDSGWIKPVRESGRGIWALTNAGKLKVQNEA